MLRSYHIICLCILLISSQTQQSAATVSSLGYQNVLATGEPGLLIHYQLGGKVPDNGCTRAGAPLASDGVVTTYLHISISAASAVQQSGYLALSFAGRSGKMIPADAVIATDSVASYHIAKYGITPADKTTGWAEGMAYLQQDGARVLCFSRKLDNNAAAVVKQINPKAPLYLNWALGRSNQLSLHSKAGSVDLILASASSSSVLSDNGGMSLSYVVAIWVHGALMLAAFVLLMPTAALMARHKWLAADSKAGTLKPFWFQVHRTCNCIALLAAVTAFILIFVRFRWISTGRLVNTYTGHRAVGITAVSMMLVQVLLGVLRPHLGTEKRPIWRRLHQAFGWLTIAMGTAACYMGISLVSGITAIPLSWFLAPALAVSCLLVVSGVVLEIRKIQLERAGRYNKNNHTVNTGLAGDVVVKVDVPAKAHSTTAAEQQV